MLPPFTVALDFHGVVADPSEARIRAAKALYNADLSAQAMSKRTFPLGLEKYREVVRLAVDEYDALLTPLPGVRAALQALDAEGFRFVLVTNRPDRARPGIEAFLSAQQLPVKDIRTSPEKAAAIRGLGAHAAVDDTLSNLESLRDDPVVLLWMRTAWNAQERPRPWCLSARDWEAAAAQLRAVRKAYAEIAAKKQTDNPARIFRLWERHYRKRSKAS